MTSLAADIGGTYSRLAWAHDSASRWLDEQLFHNAEFDSLEAVIDRGLEMLGGEGPPIDQMVLAVPGPVHDDPVMLTNINWRVQRDALQQRYQIARLSVVNDFQAAALGAVTEPYEHLRVLNPVTPDDGPVVVAGVGTGLGMAWLPNSDMARLPHPTEGGHLDFAPNNDREVALYGWLAERYGHVSYERILSGDGLLDSYRFVAGEGAQATNPAAIAALAGQGNAHAREALQMFIAIFAAYAGNLALAFTPTGGIYLCGGLAVHLADWFDPTSFMTSYAAKGRMADVVRRIPVFLVTRHDTGLKGAKHILKMFHRADT